MEHRTLGQTGLSVSVLGFGASPLGDEFRKTTASERQEAVDAAIDQGIDFFDVSPYYGRTLAEERLGKALGNKREKIVLATKCGRYDVDAFDFSAERVTRSVDESLQRLRTDHIDVMQVHDIEFGHLRQVIDETIPALQKVKETGKVRHIGITALPLTAMTRVAAVAKVETFLTYCRYNLMITDMDELLTPFARENGIGLINGSPLHMGILTGKGAPDWHPAPQSVKEAGMKVAEACEARGKNIADVAVRFAVEHPYASATLVGMSRREHVARNVRSIEQALDEELMDEIQRIVAPVKDLTWQTGRPENNDYDYTGGTIVTERSEALTR